jgi:YD repeat-containing protein
LWQPNGPNTPGSPDPQTAANSACYSTYRADLGHFFAKIDPSTYRNNGMTVNFTCCAQKSPSTCIGNEPMSATVTPAAKNPAAPPPPPNNIPVSVPQPTNSQICQGNPINTATGTKFQAELDYQGSGAYPLRFVRYHNTLNAQSVPASAASLIGVNWRHSYDRTLTYAAQLANPVATITRPDGPAYMFTLTNGVWTPDADVADTLAPLPNACGTTATGWKFTRSVNDEVEAFDSNGRLCSIANRAGLTQSLTYDSLSRIATITDPFGRTLTFSYDSDNQITSLTDPAGGTISYGRDAASGNLTSVTYEDGKTRTYLYESPNYPTFLTGIVDENGQRFSTYAYNVTTGDAVSTQYAGGANLITVQPVTINPNPVVTDSFGTQRTFTNTTVHGRILNTGASMPGPTCTNSATAYDVNGYIVSQTDFNGNITNSTRADPYGRNDLVTQTVEAVGTPQQRTTSTTWHPTFRVPTSIVEQGRTTTMTYDASGNLLTNTVTSGSQSRTTTYTYNTAGQVLTIDGPRTDVADITTNAYDTLGNLATTTDALGHVTTYTSYDANGRLLSMIDPNGLVTTMTYDPNGRLLSRQVGIELTTYQYDSAGQLLQVTNPDGSYTQNTYDAAHRLISVADNLGNGIVYTLDSMGNRILENTYGPSMQLSQTKSRVYNNLSRLVKFIGAAGQTTQYSYDSNGNQTQITDPLNHITGFAYDALNRATVATDPLYETTNTAYNALDQVTAITDPRSFTTQYSVDGLGNINQVSSPDAGVSTATYDSAGNVISSTDAKGQTTTISYDALNRVTSKSYSTDSTLNVTYTYDQGQNGIGRLTGLADNVGTTSYAYEIHGRLTAETRTIGGVAYLTAYSYDPAGRLASVTYPSGRQVAYSRDALGRINGVTTTKDGVVQTVLSAVTYQPFGPEQSLTFGNNQTDTRTFDQDGRMVSFTFPTKTQTLGYDAASRITSISNPAVPANVFTVGYDNADRLNNFTGSAVAQSFAYDFVGNRTQETFGLSTYNLNYATTSNQIASITGPSTKTYTFDANGSIVSDSFSTYSYDARGRMNQATTSGGTSQYLINSLGQRVEKTVNGASTVFHYDSGGRLIAESDATGIVKVEYIYLNSIPVAVLK